MRRGERREAILQAAVEAFARWGYELASTNRIAGAARVAKGLVFRHFGSKEGLFEAAVERACERVFALDDQPLPSDPFARLEEFLARRAARIQAHPAEARLIARFRCRLHSVLNPPARRIGEAYARLRHQFQQGVDTRAFRPGVDPEAGVELLLLVAEGVEHQLLDAAAAGFGEAGEVSEVSEVSEEAARAAREAGDAPTRTEGPDAREASVSVPGIAPEVVRQRARALARLLRQGIYRPGAKASASPVSVDPRPLIATIERLAPINAAGDERRERILRAAQELFAERGFDGTPAEAIAARAGVAKGLIFHHFGSKEKLYLAAVADAAARLHQMFFEQEGAPDPDLFQRMLAWTQRKTLIFQEQPLLYGLVLSAIAQPPAGTQEAVSQYVAEGVQQGWQLIWEGVDTSPFRPGVDPALAMELVIMVSETLTDRLMVQLAGHPDRGTELLPAVTERMARFLTLLRDGIDRPGDTEPVE